MDPQLNQKPRYHNPENSAFIPTIRQSAETQFLASKALADAVRCAIDMLSLSHDATPKTQNAVELLSRALEEYQKGLGN